MNDNSTYIKSMECSEPLESGMYLRLIHGRTDPEESPEDWGTDGPVFGPLEFCHITYLNTINIAKKGDHDGTGPMLSEADPMYFHNDLLFYDGVYYGDFELCMEEVNK